MRAPRSSGGFTLVELLVGLAVSAVVLTGIGMVFISQAWQYQAHASRRAVQANVRQALGFVERHVRHAGYGVDPDRAILAYDSYDAASDSPGEGYPDGLVLHARDLGFRRTVTAASPGTLSFSPPLSEPLRRGQILLVLCPGATRYAYVTVGETTPEGANSVLLDVQAAAVDSPAGPPGTHFREQAVLDEPCFHQAAEGGEPPVLVKVVRSGFYVASFDDDGDAATPGGTPYLMLHRGVDLNDDGRIDGDDATPIAVGVEQFQIAYILNTVGLAEPLMVGVSDPVPWGESWSLGTPEEERPRLDDPYGSPRRLTRHPANIRQVRLTLVARGTKPDRQRAGDDVLTLDAASTEGPSLPSGSAAWRHLENLGASPAQGFVPRGGGFSRAVLREAIAPKNLLMRSQFTPIHRGGG